MSLQRVQCKPDSQPGADIRSCNIDIHHIHGVSEYIEPYHYLGHKPLPGAQLGYFIHAQSQPIALLGFGAAARRVNVEIVSMGSRARV